MTAFDDAFAAVIGIEGGYTNDPDDSGGETKYGISKTAFPNVDIKNLTLDQAKNIYFDNYWTPSKCQVLPGHIGAQVFDFAVNAGVSEAAKTLQRALGVDDDGVVGPSTLKAALQVDLKKFAIAFAVERTLHYASQPSFPKYGRGWITRALTVAMNNEKENQQ